MTDEELAWQIAREMEQEERRQEAKDAELARALSEQYGQQYTEAPPVPYNPFISSSVDPEPAAPVHFLRKAIEVIPEPPKVETVPCPLCEKSFDFGIIEDHVEECLLAASKKDEMRRSRGKSSRPNRDEVYDPVTMQEFECPICMDDVSPGAGYKYEKCGHQYCGVCLEGYYQELIAKGEVEKIVCPSPNCGSEITQADLQYILAPAMYEKYQLFLRNAKINKDPTMRWCPNPGCEEPVKRKDPQNLLMVCSKCETEFCYSCSKDFHPGKTCSEADKFSLFGEGFRVRVWKSFHTKPCPKCDAPIHKSSGCNHMTCGSCKHEFCWLCKQPFSWSHWSDSACTMYGSQLNVIGIAKRIIKLPSFIKKRLESNDSDSE